MGQLDLFSLGPKPETANKKVEKKTDDLKQKSNPENVGNKAEPEEISPRQSFIKPKEEVAENIPVNTAEEKAETIVFSDERIRIEVKTNQKEEVKKEKSEEKIEAADDSTLMKNLKVNEVKIIQKRGRKSFKDIDAEVDLIEIPEDEILFKKQYYSISEVAGWFKVNTSLLRFWETEFDILKPRKNKKGDRMFRPEDVKNLQLIYHLLRDRKYTIDGAKDYIKGNKKKADTQLQLTQSLQKFKSFLLELKANLQ